MFEPGRAASLRERLKRGARRGGAAALLALAAAGPAGAAQAKNPDTLVYAIIGDVNSLDPAWQYDSISHAVQQQIYENLIFFRGSSTEDFDPMLATVVPDRKNGLISKDGLTYSFPLRKNAAFHDGTVMTPEDVRYSILRFLLTDRASGPSALLLEPLLGVQTVAGPDGRPVESLFDEAERAVRIEAGALVLRLKKPYAPLLSVLAGFCPIQSKAFTVSGGGWDGTRETWTRHFNVAKEASALFDRVNGTGPFKLERWDKENKQVFLARHEGYWRAPAKLKRIVYRTVSEANTRKLMLAAGDADAALMERQFLAQVSALEGVTVVDDLPLLETHNAFLFGMKVSPEANPHIGSGQLDGEGIPPNFFADHDARRGFAHAFDYEAYIRDGYRGKGARARGPIPRGVFGHNPRQPARDFDLKKAEGYLRRAWGGQAWQKGLRLTAVYMEGRADRQLACQILKKGIESLNPKFRVDVRGVQWSTYLSQFSKFPLVNARWALDFADPHAAVLPFLHSQGNYAKTQGYSNPRADLLIAQASGELDLAKRRQLYAELQAIAYEDVPQLFTLDTYDFYVTRSWVKGWQHNPVVIYGYLYPVHKGD